MHVMQQKKKQKKNWRISHVLVSCTIYLVLRKQFIPNFLDLNKQYYYTILYNPLLQNMNNLYFYKFNCLKIDIRMYVQYVFT